MSLQSLVLTSTLHNIGLITLNRPSSLNALSSALIKDLLDALAQFDASPEVGAIIITGSDTIFCGEHPLHPRDNFIEPAYQPAQTSRS